MENRKYIILGISDSVDACDCCGKTGLKRTVAMTCDGDNVEFFGCTCAANKLNSQRLGFLDGRQVAYFATKKPRHFQELVKAKALERVA